MLRRPTASNILALLLLISLPLWAQGTASLTGYANDPSDAVIPGATVTITNTQTGAVRRLKTDAAGRYFASALDPGNYIVEVQAPGFDIARRTGVVLTIGEQQGLNFTLSLASSQKSVTVAAESSRVETETGQIGYLISNKEIESIAVNGRNFVTLAALAPGAASNLADEPLVGNLGRADIAYNGSPSYQNVWMIDGAFNIDTARASQPLLTYPAIEALSEFRVLSNNYSAEYGLAGGAVVTMGIKSGTNSWHGALYEFVRNDAFDARNAFLLQRQLLKQNDFGFTLGGPIRKDKTFFFYSQEFRRNRQESAISVHTPSSQELAGDFSGSPITGGKTLKDPTGRGCVTGFQVSPSCFDKNALLILKAGLFPVPNQSGFQNFSAGVPNPQNFRQEILRVDHHFNDSISIFGHYIRDNFDYSSPTSVFGSDTIPTIGSTVTTPGTNATIGLTHIISSRLINEAHLSYEGEVISSANFGPFRAPSGLDTFRIFQAGSPNVPGLNMSQGYGFLDAGPNPWYTMEGVYTAQDHFTLIKGQHVFKFGGLYQYQVKDQPIQTGTQGTFAFNGSFTGNTFADFLLGYPNSFSQLGRQLRGRYRYNEFEFFAQDDWKITKRLALNLGLRYYFSPPAYELQNQLVEFLPSLFTPSQAPQLNAQGNIVANTGNLQNGLVFPEHGIDRGVAKTHYLDLGPRIGFAWDPWGSGMTVFRGGFGVTYDRPPIGEYFNLLSNYPQGTTLTINNPPFDSGGPSAAPISAPPNLTTINPDLRSPRTLQFSLGIQRQLPRSAIISVSYVGTHSTHMLGQQNINQPLPFGIYSFNPILNQNPAPPTNLYRPYQGWGNITTQVSDGNSEYNSMQVNLEKRMTGNLHFQLAYTYSKAMNNYDGNATNPQNAYNRRADWGLAAIDHTQILTVNYIYDLPFLRHRSDLAGKLLGDWELAGVTSAQSGAPLNVTLSGAGNGLAGRPNLIKPLTYPKTVAEWFDISAFAAPAPGFYGNAGRDIIRGPGLQVWNVSLYKHFIVRERFDGEFRAESFNLFNHTNFKTVTTALGSGSFGQVTASHDPRVLQFGVRVRF